MNAALLHETPRQTDFRRRRRRHAERLLEQARHLPPRERLLLEQVYRHGLALAEVARLTGRPAYQVRRRVARLLRRTRSPAFSYLAVHAPALPRPQRQIAELAIFGGHSLRRCAALSGQSLHHVRLDLHRVQVLAGC